MARLVSQHVCHLGCRNGFFKTYIFELSRKHMFTASNRNITKIIVEKKKLEQLTAFNSNFNLRY